MEKSLREQLTEEILRARERVHHLNKSTPLEKIDLEDVPAEVYLKREDLSIINSYKWRGAYNAISLLNDEERKKPIIAASAGNHAQGVALSANLQGLKAKIFMPVSTPQMKQVAVKKHGGDNVEVILEGEDFDQTYDAAKKEAKKNGGAFIYPFDNLYTIAGQATIADEIVLSGEGPFDYAFIQIGGGGLAAGISAWLRIHYPDIKIIGVEGEGQASMKAAMAAGAPVTLDEIDTFCDATAIKRVGDIPFEICKDTLDDIITISNEEVCSAIKTIWESRRVIPEPSGAMGLAGLIKYAAENAKEIKGKKACAIVTGANMDFDKLKLISVDAKTNPEKTEEKGWLQDLLDLVESVVNNMDT